MKIGDEIYVHGHIDEIRKDTIIVSNNGGYFGTVPSEIVTNPNSGWIQCRNRLPSNEDWMIVTICDSTGDTLNTYTDFGWYLDVADCWIIDGGQRVDVVAWRPLPKPWAGESYE